MRGRYLIATTACGVLTCSAAHGGIVLIDFSTEDDGVTPLSNGQIIDSEFGTLFNLSSSGPNAGLAIFDTTSGVNAADPDLWVNTGNALILQADNDDDNDGSFFSSPNDDAGGGTIVFDFIEPVELLAIDLIDINGSNQAALLTLVDVNGLERIYDVPSEWTGDISQGDPGIGTLDLTSLLDQPGFLSTATATEDAGFDATMVTELSVMFASSGALDNLTLVPGPPAILLLAGAGLIGRRRRRRS